MNYVHLYETHQYFYGLPARRLITNFAGRDSLSSSHETNVADYKYVIIATLTCTDVHVHVQVQVRVTAIC